MLGRTHLAELSCMNLGESKETLGDRNDILHLLNGVDSVLDSLGVFSTSTVENSLDFGNLGLSPITVGFADGLESKLPRQYEVGFWVDWMRALTMKPMSKKKPTAITVSSFMT